MKIKVEFTQKEKVAMMMATETTDCIDEHELYKGKFGSIDYDPNGSITMDLNENMVLGFSSIIGKTVSLVKSIAVFCEDFINEWFDEIEYTSPSKLVYDNFVELFNKISPSSDSFYEDFEEITMVYNSLSGRFKERASRYYETVLKMKSDRESLHNLNEVELRELFKRNKED